MTPESDTGPDDRPRQALEVWQEPDGFWRWRYVDRQAGVELLGNELYDAEEGAVRAAQVSYPGVAVHVAPRSSDPASGRGRRLALRLLVVSAFLALGVVAAVLLVVLTLRRLLRPGVE